MNTFLLMARCNTDDLPLFAGSFTACDFLLADFQNATNNARTVLNIVLEKFSLDISEILNFSIISFANTGEVLNVMNRDAMRANELLQPVAAK